METTNRLIPPGSAVSAVAGTARPPQSSASAATAAIRLRALVNLTEILQNVSAGLVADQGLGRARGPDAVVDLLVHRCPRFPLRHARADIGGLTQEPACPQTWREV